MVVREGQSGYGHDYEYHQQCCRFPETSSEDVQSTTLQSKGGREERRERWQSEEGQRSKREKGRAQRWREGMRRGCQNLLAFLSASASHLVKLFRTSPLVPVALHLTCTPSF